MSDTELCYLSASAALGRFKARQLSPVELMQAVIARAQKVDPKINAFPIKPIVTDRRKPTVNPYGPIYGAVTHVVSTHPCH